MYPHSLDTFGGAGCAEVGERDDSADARTAGGLDDGERRVQGAAL